MKVLEKLSTIAVFAMALAVIITLWRSDFRIAGPAPGPVANEGKLKGQRVDARSLPATDRKVTILVGLSSHCQFCSRNLDLYRKLGSLRSKDLRVVLVMPQQGSEAEAYAAANKLGADAIVSEPLNKFLITATPTILLLDEKSTITSAWIGVLNESREKELLSSLKLQCSSCVPAGASNL